MFDKENIIDLSKFTNCKANPEISENPHIVIILDGSGSSKTKVSPERYQKICNSLFNEISKYTYLYNDGRQNLEDIDNFFQINNTGKEIIIEKSLLFRLRALECIKNLHDRKYSGHLSLIIFNEKAEYYPFEDNFNEGIKYLIPSQRNKASKNQNRTNFYNLFETINNTICKNNRAHNLVYPPKYVFIFLTDFIHEQANSAQTDIDEQKKLIQDQISKFYINSNFANFYYFPEDTLNSSQGNKKFSIFGMIKNLEKESAKLISIQDYNQIELGYQYSQEFLPLYFTKPFSNKILPNAKITFDSLQEKHSFTISINTPSTSNEQYYFTIGSSNEKMYIGKIPQHFLVNKDDSIKIFYQGYVPNQYPAHTLLIKDESTQKNYKIDVIFFRDLSRLSKYIFLFICLLIGIDLSQMIWSYFIPVKDLPATCHLKLGKKIFNLYFIPVCAIIIIISLLIYII